MMGSKMADNMKMSPLRAYQRVEEDIRRKVRDGRLPAGTMLAGRHSLAREYGVALSTAQQAVARLITDGVLETSDRRGTFVAHPPPDTAQGAGRATLILGIVATARIAPDAARNVGSVWMTQAIRSLEMAFSAAGGATRFFERYPEGRGPYPQGLNEANAVPIPDAIRALRADGADAIAVIGLCDSRDMSDAVIEAVDIDHVPTVYLSWHEIAPPLAQIFYDNRDAGYQAARHLLTCGYRRLTFLAPFADAWLSERIDGARDAVRHAGLPPDTLCLYPCVRLDALYDPTVFGGHALASALCADLLTNKDAAGPVGVIAPNDAIAYAVLDAAAASGLSVGRDFGLLGFDDDAGSCAAGMTTVRPPVEAMGEEAARLLLRALAGDNKGLRLCLRSHLIPRASTALRLPGGSGKETL